MLQLEQLKPFFPPYLWDNAAHRKYLIKEYIQLLILDYLTTTAFVKKIVFIGGTNLRLVKGIDRFSEDLDCKNLSDEEFITMTDGIVEFLKRMGYHVETRDKKNDKLLKMLKSVDLRHKSKDFEHLVFHETSTKKILYFKKFIEEWNT